MTDQCLIKAARELCEDADWLDDFCRDCEAMEIHNATEPTYACGGEPGYVTCPAENNPLDCGCVRHELIYEDEAVIACATEREVAA